MQMRCFHFASPCNAGMVVLVLLPPLFGGEATSQAPSPKGNPPAASNLPANGPRASGRPRFGFSTETLPTGVPAQPNIPYVKNGHPNQVLDLFLPEQPSNTPLPLMIWIHGGAWLGGSHANPSMLYLVSQGSPWPASTTGFPRTPYGPHRPTIATRPSASSAPPPINTDSIPTTSGSAAIPPADTWPP